MSYFIYLGIFIFILFSLNLSSISLVSALPTVTFPTTTNSTVDCLSIVGGTDGNFCVDSTGAGGNSSWTQAAADLIYAPISVTGDINSVQGNDGYIVNGSTSGDVYLYINLTKLDTRYAVSQWGYNQTSPAILYTNNLNTTYNIYWKNWTGEANATIINVYGYLLYNYTTGANTYTNAQIVANSTFSYNHTTQILTILNSTICSANSFVTGVFVNGTWRCSSVAGANLTFNQSVTDLLYASIVWNYNQTTPAIAQVTSLNNTYYKLWNNHTSATLTAISSITCGTNTYQTGIYINGTPICTAFFNYTTPAISYIDSINSSYNKWWNNQTDGAKTYTDAQIVANTTSILYTYQVAGTQSTTNNATVNNWAAVVLTIPLQNFSNYTYTCKIGTLTGASTTGVQLNLSLDSSVQPRLFSSGYSHPTSATADGFVYCDGVVRSCASLSTAGLSSGLMVWIDGTIRTNLSWYNLSLAFRSETATSVSIRDGSYCALNKIP